MDMADDINNNLLTAQHKFQEQDDDEDHEAEESLSLRDLPLQEEESDDINSLDPFRKNSRRSSSEPLDLFEFFTSGLISSEICPAEDLIVCGRLIPLNDHSPLMRTSEKNFRKEDNRKQTIYRKRSESLPGLQSSVTRSNSTKINLKRNSRSLDYRKLYHHGNSLFSPAPEIDRNYSVKNGAKSETLVKKASRPRWYLLMFGMVKFPTEMELSDIKSRQFRRNSSVLLPTGEDRGKFPNNRSSGESTWRLLRALSCKNYASADVRESLTA